MPQSLLDELTELLDRKQFDKAYAKLTATRRFSPDRWPPESDVCLRARPPRCGRWNWPMKMKRWCLKHRTTYLATIGTLGPMIGLVGTVYGMILSFRVIATAGASPQAGALGGGDLHGPLRDA